jgi:hypothetical protein
LACMGRVGTQVPRGVGQVPRVVGQKLDWITRTNWPAQTGGGTLGKPSPLTTSRNWLPGLVRGALNKCLPFLSVSGTVGQKGEEIERRRAPGTRAGWYFSG